MEDGCGFAAVDGNCQHRGGFLCFWDCVSGSQIFSFSPAGHSSFNAKALRFN